MADDEARFPYNSQLDAFDLYHIVQEETRPRRAPLGPALPALGHATSGALGSAISKLLIYPLDLVITRLQVQAQFKQDGGEKEEGGGDDDDDAEYKDIIDAARKIYAREGGLPAFYSGVAQDLVKSVADSFLFFLAYTFVKSSRQARKADPKKALPAFEEIAVGMVAGAFSKFWTTPVQNVVTRKQTASMVAARDRTSSSSSASAQLGARDIARQIRREKGVAGFWSGYSAALILTLNPAVTFLLHESLLRVLVPRARRADPGSRLTFLIAALSKVVASTITYPVALAKTRTQVSSQAPAAEEASEERPLKAADGNSAAAKRTKRAGRATIVGSIVQIARREGVKGLYQGLGGEVLKGFFSHGLTMLMKERIHVVVIQLYYVILKALRRYPSAQELAAEAKEEMKEAVEAGRELVGSASEKMAEAMERTSTQAGDVYGRSRERAVELVKREGGKRED
ncbi:mitochondrial carrier domain-containing protein [Macrophomina phaseolina]|uniref:Mitochondrial carrier domain-containing protein n=1 Tax=Macrophomina phaseolina TaxID=35725 RepID=A0ABQ8G3Y6_9PEZI|nr:mitochondrial carrier domain-containing protein [Macrophomina phaseolina]